MKNKILVVIAVILTLPFPARAAYNDVVLGVTDTILNVNGADLIVSANGATMDSIVVNSDNFVVTMSPNSYIKVSSAGLRTMSSSGAGASTAFACGSSASTYEIDYPAGTGTSVLTYTVTVSSSACSSGSNGGVGGGGSPGAVSISSGSSTSGGSSSSVSSSPVSSQVTSTPAPATTVAPTSVSTPTVSAVFTKALSVGSRNKDVTRLQTLLSSDPTVYPEGTVSGYFGVATRKAVQKFQEKYGLATSGSQGYGVFGPATRAKVQEVFGGQTTVTGGTTASPTEMTASEAQAKINALMEQIKKLQGN